MFRARPIYARDAASGDKPIDFEDMVIVSAEKRRIGPEPRPSDHYSHRIIKLRAIRVLQDAKFSSQEISIVLGVTPRDVRRKRAAIKTLKSLAEAQGRV